MKKIKKIVAMALGVAKINVNTECQLAFQEATRKYIEEGKVQWKSVISNFYPDLEEAVEIAEQELERKERRAWTWSKSRTRPSWLAKCEYCGKGQEG